jgi:hypothetical protein
MAGQWVEDIERPDSNRHRLRTLAELRSGLRSLDSTRRLAALMALNATWEVAFDRGPIRLPLLDCLGDGIREIREEAAVALAELDR